MDFPREKMEIIASHAGKSSDQAWLVLHLGTLDLEGITKIYISLDDIEDVRKRGASHSEAVKRMRSLLGGEE